jgi:hypothetical protein
MEQYQDLLENWARFIKMIQNSKQSNETLADTMTQRYVEQNIEILNDVLISSIEHLKRLQKATTLNDTICTQARLTDEIGKKLMLIAQKFFNASLSNVSDYNDWLKSHCDLIN